MSFPTVPNVKEGSRREEPGVWWSYLPSETVRLETQVGLHSGGAVFLLGSKGPTSSLMYDSEEGF